MSDLSQSLLVNSKDDSAQYSALDEHTTPLPTATSSHPGSQHALSMRDFIIAYKRPVIITCAVTAIVVLAVCVIIVAQQTHPEHHPACDSLYEFACRAWLDNTTLAPDQPSFSRSFGAMAVENTALLQQILDTGSGSPLLGVLYRSCLDTDGIRRAGASALQPLLDQLQGVQSWQDWMRLAGVWRLQASAPLFFTSTVRTSPYEPSVVFLELQPSGLSLAQGNAYNDTALMSQLQHNISVVFRLLGDNETAAVTNAAAVLTVERWLAGVQASSGGRGRSYGVWNPFNSTDSLPLPLHHYMEGANISFPARAPRFNIPLPAFFGNLSAAMRGAPTHAHLQYARWRLVSAVAAFLPMEIFSLLPDQPQPSELNDADNSSSSKFPLQELPLSAAIPRSEYCRRVVNSPDALADLLGQEFMAQRFGPDSHSVVQAMVHEIRAAWSAYLPNVTWLDEAGRRSFERKMQLMSPHLGGPTPIAAYGSLNLQPALLANILTLRAAHNADTFSALQAPWDTARGWGGAAASTVNAFYNSVGNSYYLYAGFFQAPFFFPANGSSGDPLGVDAIANFPWTGEVVGHEAGHGFDTNGIRWNEWGANASWLSDSVMAEFNTRVRCVEASYSRLTMFGIAVNGTRSISENLADIIGIRLAHVAYGRWLEKQSALPSPPAHFVPAVETADQYFFTRWAQTECVKYTPEALKQQILNNVHAPGFARIDGAAQLLPPVAAAFNCPVGTEMNPADRCFIY